MESATIAFIWIVSFVIGVYAATHQYRLGDYFASFIGFVGLAVPNFLLRPGAALCRQGLFRPVDRRPDGSRVHRQP
jgi:ABC-type dipeptide/oligopeptide/nickel transport system permease component